MNSRLKNSLINSFQQEKLKKVNLMVDKLNRILSVYAADESIDIIVQKKYCNRKVRSGYYRKNIKDI